MRLLQYFGSGSMIAARSASLQAAAADLMGCGRIIGRSSGRDMHLVRPPIRGRY